MIVGQEKPPLEALAHFGIKGMKWGVRKQHTAKTPRPIKTTMSDGRRLTIYPKNQEEADLARKILAENTAKPIKKARSVQGPLLAAAVLASFGARAFMAYNGINYNGPGPDTSTVWT